MLYRRKRKEQKDRVGNMGYSDTQLHTISHLIYLGCVMCEQVEKIEKLFNEKVDANSDFLYNSPFQNLFKISKAYSSAAITSL